MAVLRESFGESQRGALSALVQRGWGLAAEAVALG